MADEFANYLHKKDDKQKNGDLKKKKPIAHIYQDVDECIADQMKMGKTKTDATEIAIYLKSFKEKQIPEMNSKHNLIFIRPGMDLTPLPDTHLLCYEQLLPLWLNSKKTNIKFLPEYSIEDIQTMLHEINIKLQNRGLRELQTTSK